MLRTLSKGLKIMSRRKKSKPKWSKMGEAVADVLKVTRMNNLGGMFHEIHPMEVDGFASICDKCHKKAKCVSLNHELSNEDCVVCGDSISWCVYCPKGANMIEFPSELKKGKDKGWTGNTSWSGTGYTTQSYKPCTHPGDKVVFEFDGKALFGSNSHSLNEYSGKWKLIIDLAGLVPYPDQFGFVKAGSTDKFGILRQFTGTKPPIPSDILRLNWQDMGIPNATLDFWLQLWDILPETTVMACQGGHGRTGSCLVALMIAAGLDYYTALETARTEHCSKAVETVGQEVYLHTLYTQRLIRQLSAAKDDPDVKPGDLVDLAADLKYAKDNPPDSKTSNAVKNYSKK
jgi:hypothetical protein